MFVKKNRNTHKRRSYSEKNILPTLIYTSVALSSISLLTLSLSRQDTDFKVVKRIDGDPLYQYFRVELNKSFNFAFGKCPAFPEVRPGTGDCVFSSNLPLLAIESIEALSLFRLKEEYTKAVKYLKNSFRCKNLKWVSRRELWTRVVGSLIGAYYTTGDSMFISKAEECAMRSIDVDHRSSLPYAFQNLKTTESKSSSWEPLTTIADITAGLPEIASLYLITKNPDFKKSLDTLLAFFTHQKGLTFSYVDSQSMDLLTNITNPSAIVDSLGDFVRLSLIIESPEVDAIIKASVHSLLDVHLTERAQSHLDESLSLLKAFKPHLIPKSYSHSPVYKQIEFSPLRIKKSTHTFTFDASVARSIYYTEPALVDYIFTVLEHTKYENGFSSYDYLKNGTRIAHDVMPSSLFGQWFSLAGRLISPCRGNVTRPLMNSKGHLISFISS